MLKIAFQSIRNQTFLKQGMLPDPLQVSTPSLKKSWNRPCALLFSFTKYENLFGHWPVSVSKLQHKKYLIVGIEWVRWTFCDNVTRYFSFLSQHNAGLAFLLLIHALSFYTLSNSSTVEYPSLYDPQKCFLLTFPLNVRLNRSTWPSDCGWNGVVRVFSMLST